MKCMQVIVLTVMNLKIGLLQRIADYVGKWVRDSSCVSPTHLHYFTDPISQLTSSTDSIEPQHL